MQNWGTAPQNEEVVAGHVVKREGRPTEEGRKLGGEGRGGCQKESPTYLWYNKQTIIIHGIISVFNV